MHFFVQCYHRIINKPRTTRTMNYRSGECVSSSAITFHVRRDLGSARPDMVVCVELVYLVNLHTKQPTHTIFVGTYNKVAYNIHPDVTKKIVSCCTSATVEVTGVYTPGTHPSFLVDRITGMPKKVARDSIGTESRARMRNARKETLCRCKANQWARKMHDRSIYDAIDHQQPLHDRRTINSQI